RRRRRGQRRVGAGLLGHGFGTLRGPELRSASRSLLRYPVQASRDPTVARLRRAWPGTRAVGMAFGRRALVARLRRFGFGLRFRLCLLLDLADGWRGRERSALAERIVAEDLLGRHHTPPCCASPWSSRAVTSPTRPRKSLIVALMPYLGAKP